MKNDICMLGLSLINFIGSLIVIFLMPNIVPIHINLDLIVDVMGSKWINLILAILPLLFVIFMLLFKHKVGKDFQNIKSFNATMIVLCVFFIYLNWVFLFFTNSNLQLGEKINVPISLIVGMPIRILLIFMGYLLPYIKQNKFFGIKLHSTLKNEKVWNETHKFSGIVWIYTGFIIIISALICHVLNENLIFIIIMCSCLLILVILIPTIYSIKIQSKISKDKIVCGTCDEDVSNEKK